MVKKKKSACNVGDMGLIPGQEDALEKEMAPHSSNSCLGDPMGYNSWGCKSNQPTTTTFATK